MNQTDRASSTDWASARFVALVIVCCLVLLALSVVVWSGVTTASARFAATTSNDSSLLSAAEVDLVVESTDEVAATGLLIDAAGLYPGLVVERCVEITYWGSASDVAVRMFGRPGGGTGLENYIEMDIQSGTATDPECSDFVPNSTVFDDTLRVFWDRHPSFDDGLPVMDAAQSGVGTWARFSLQVADDNAAQNLTTEFWLTVEARP